MENTIFTRIKQKHGLSSEWSSKIDFIPLNGELIIYDDHKTLTDEQGVVHNLPGFKFGNGVDTINNLPFVTEELEQQLLDHINNSKIHLQDEEREYWNNKVSASVSGERIIFN